MIPGPQRFRQQNETNVKKEPRNLIWALKIERSDRKKNKKGNDFKNEGKTNQSTTSTTR